ncbi:MAG: DUF3567 family protein [Pseudomonadota bacterium]|jgi:hypothetical protein
MNLQARLASKEVSMNVVYDSDHYYVAEFPGHAGIELVDKTTGRSGFLEGAVERKFRQRMANLAAEEPSEESVDEFLAHYDALLTTPLALH